MRTSRLMLGLLFVAVVACGDETSLGSVNAVNVNGTAFDPSTLTVSGANKLVTFGIFGGGPHTITFQDGVTSGQRASGVYQRNFGGDTVGTYLYRCENHSAADYVTGMVGRIIVQ